MKTLIIVSSIIGIIIVYGVLSCVFSFGVFNKIIRNAIPLTIKLKDEEWKNGIVYDKIQYSNISENDYLDLYIPNNVSNPPLLILIHGGGFVENDSKSRQAQFMYKYFRDHGYACASINYRLTDEAKYPAAINDVKAAVRYLKANADKYGFDKNRIAIWGESAGGYLASMTALTQDKSFLDVKYIGEDDNSIITSRVNILIDYYGILSFDNIKEDFHKSGVPYFLHKISSPSKYTPENWIEKDIKKATIYQHINELNKDLKVFITHGDVDITVPYVQSKELYDLLIGKIDKQNIVYKIMKNYKHADDRFYSDDNLKVLLDFLNYHLK